MPSPSEEDAHRPARASEDLDVPSQRDPAAPRATRPTTLTGPFGPLPDGSGLDGIPDLHGTQDFLQEATVRAFRDGFAFHRCSHDPYVEELEECQ